MNSIKKEMLKIYKPISGLDWLNYRLVKKDLTYHHILKKSDGGKETIDNGALLMPISHQYLHLIECKDIETYNAINKLFSYINMQKYEPTIQQRVYIEYLLSEFERVHKWDKGSKGKLIIKRKYLERDVF